MNVFGGGGDGGCAKPGLDMVLPTKPAVAVGEQNGAADAAALPSVT